MNNYACSFCRKHLGMILISFVCFLREVLQLTFYPLPFLPLVQQQSPRPLEVPAPMYQAPRLIQIFPSTNLISTCPKNASTFWSVPVVLPYLRNLRTCCWVQLRSWAEALRNLQFQLCRNRHQSLTPNQTDQFPYFIIENFIVNKTASV